MKKNKVFGLGLLFTLSAIFFGFMPVGAKAINYNWDNNYNRYNWNSRYDRNLWDGNYGRNMIYRHYPSRFNYPYLQNYNYGSYGMIFPRTVYLVDASNSANQLNIINATRGGSLNAAYITVAPDVYNRVVNDYNVLGIVSISLDSSGNLVTFSTAGGTFSASPILISYQ